MTGTSIMKELKTDNYKHFLEILLLRKCITHRDVFMTLLNICDGVFDENNWHLGNCSLVSQKIYICFAPFYNTFLLVINRNRTSIYISWSKCRNYKYIAAITKSLRQESPTIKGFSALATQKIVVAEAYWQPCQISKMECLRK